MKNLTKVTVSHIQLLTPACFMLPTSGPLWIVQSIAKASIVSNLPRSSEHNPTQAGACRTYQDLAIATCLKTAACPPPHFEPQFACSTSTHSRKPMPFVWNIALPDFRDDPFQIRAPIKTWQHKMLNIQEDVYHCGMFHKWCLGQTNYIFIFFRHFHNIFM